MNEGEFIANFSTLIQDVEEIENTVIKTKEDIESIMSEMK